MRTGVMRVVHNPNSAFAQLRLGSVRRLRWETDLGLEAFGDLVLPPDYRPGDQLPLVVVQYHSDGFLRGGTGDEVPIYLLAERGLAVLSIERPPVVAMAFPNLRSWDEANAANQKEWGERRNLLSAVLGGVQAAIATGTVDSARVGITGLSDGATTAAFALINSSVFAAAMMSSCCIEPQTTMAVGGVGWADWLRTIGYPPMTANDQSFWAPMSLAQNANRIETPVLLQLSDQEFRLGLEAFAALREQRKAVELYIFPNESHVKTQPWHRRAIYERTIDWFNFWLRDIEDAAPAKRAQFERWRAMRALQSHPLESMPLAEPAPKSPHPADP
jgi:dipeptidyl aminopeptidase/acylaminoacyl peptidase